MRRRGVSSAAKLGERSELSREAWRAERAQPRRAKLGERSELSHEAWQAERARPRNALASGQADSGASSAPHTTTHTSAAHGGEAKSAWPKALVWNMWNVSNVRSPECGRAAEMSDPIPSVHAYNSLVQYSDDVGTPSSTLLLVTKGLLLTAFFALAGRWECTYVTSPPGRRPPISLLSKRFAVGSNGSHRFTGRPCSCSSRFSSSRRRSCQWRGVACHAWPSTTSPLSIPRRQDRLSLMDQAA